MQMRVSSAWENPYDDMSQITRDLITALGVHTPKMDL